MKSTLLPHSELYFVAQLVIYNIYGEIQIAKGKKSLQKQLSSILGKTAKAEYCDSSHGGNALLLKYEKITAIVEVTIDNIFHVTIKNLGGVTILAGEYDEDYGMVLTKTNSSTKELVNEAIANAPNCNDLIQSLSKTIQDKLSTKVSREFNGLEHSARELVRIACFKRVTTYYVEFTHEQLTWRYVLSANMLMLIGADSQLSVSLDTDQITYNIQPLENHSKLGRRKLNDAQLYFIIKRVVNSLSNNTLIKGDVLLLGKVKEVKVIK